MQTSTGPAEIITDRGRCYLKALGNKEGPHVLAADWVGTALADWFGLRTFAVAKLRVLGDDEIALGHGRRANPGTAIAFKAESGDSWGGTRQELNSITNPEQISRLVVLDTWLLNCDRYPADTSARKPNWNNVFLSTEDAPAGKFHLTAFDHTHCFTCGRDLKGGINTIDRVKDARVYGNFPEFADFVDRQHVIKGVNLLRKLDRGFVESIVAGIAPDWEVSKEARHSLVELIVDRAEYVASSVVDWLFP